MPLRSIKLKSLLTRDGERNLGAIARRGLNLRSATDAVHPLHDGIADTVAVFRDRLRIKTCATVANENGKLAGKVLGVDIDGVNTCMLAGIDHGFARSHHRELGVFRQRSEEHTSALQSRFELVCSPLLERQ